jgi:hypothetical protein
MKVIPLSLWIVVVIAIGCSQKTELAQNNYYSLVAISDPLLNHVVQDIDTGSIYRVGTTGSVIDQLKPNAGKLRGFDLKDSLLAWCTDSLAITLLNRNTNKTRVITFDSIKIHHDLVVHYPFMTALYKSDRMRDYKGYQVFDDGIVKVDLRNNEYKTWSVHDVLNNAFLPDSLGDGRKRLNTHSNSVEIDIEGNYYISFRDISQVWKLSGDLSTVLYRIGESSPFTRTDGDDFVGQHSVDIIRPNEFFLFDNGSTGRDKAVKSRIVRVSVNPGASTYLVKNILSLPDSLSTARMGSVQALGDRLSVSMYNFGFHILELDTTGNIHNHLFRLKANAIKVLPEFADE